MFHNNQQACNDQEKAQLFNNYFYSVFSSDIITPVSESVSTSTLQDIEITESEVLTILSSLDGNKAPGIDNISPLVYKCCALSLLKPICHLFAVSLSSGNIPSQWRTHWITPIYKCGDKSLVNNYRPISLLCILSKVLERVVYNNILRYSECSFSCHQFGFLQGRSAVQQLLLFTERVLEAKSLQAEADVVYMDFRKAFDSVSHDGLLQKLHAAGITGKLWSWLQSYLKHRSQCVRIGASNSALCKVLSGVPQGSVLGPLLFVIFINDLPQCIHSAIPFIFADDTKCLLAIKSTSDSDKLQQDINNISTWSYTFNLLFNESKFVHLCFWQKTSLDTPKYAINGNLIRRMSQHKDLRVTFSTDLHWTEHYNIIIAKAYQTLGLLRRTFSVGSIAAKKQLYISLVRSQLLYCSQLWRPQLLKDVFTLERVQRRATKYILNNYELPYKVRLERLHLLPLMYTYELNDLIFFVKSLKAPMDHFDIRRHIQFARNPTRSVTSSKLVHIKALQSSHHHFYFNRIVRLWNHLPEIDTSLSIHTIKNQIIAYLWNQFTTSFNSDSLCSYHVICPCYRCSRQPVSVNFYRLTDT